ncbi:MAG: dihydrolipoyl dehydrogenase [Chloroflexi bacterium]|nr:dihydrolipoyl dehydrogenase [Chloroflexota bacterium]
MPETEYDVAIVGGGPGGYVAAIRASQLGAKVVLVEKDKVGGTCLNRGCIPVKAMTRSVEVYLDAKRGEEFGIKTSGLEVDFPKLMARKQQVVDRLVSGVEGLLQGSNVTVMRGSAKLASPRRLAVDGKEVAAKKIILATGSVPSRVPVPGLDLPGVVTSDDVVQLDRVPKSMVIIGGGVIGMEFASIFAAIGTKVTVVEMLPLIMPPVDEELARRFTQIARRQGMSIVTGAKVTGVRQAEGGLEVAYELSSGAQSTRAEMVLVAVGRSPYTEGLGLADLGITMNRRAVAVNDHLQTNIDGVYAIGDVTGRIMLAHVASYDGEVAVENALGKHDKATDYKVVPSVIFTIPEIAGVGLTEKQARDRPDKSGFKVGRFPLSASGRAQTLGETTGLVKVIADAETKELLGVHIMGPRACDLIAEAALAIKLEATAQDIAETIHAHPTLPETIREATLEHLEGAIHVLSRPWATPGPSM